MTASIDEVLEPRPLRILVLGEARLPRERYDVTVATDARSVRATLEADVFDAFVAVEGSRDGRALVALVAARESAPATPRILVLALDDYDLPIRAVNEAHVARCLRAPVDPDGLARVVHEVVRAGRAAERRTRAMERAVTVLG